MNTVINPGLSTAIMTSATTLLVVGIMIGTISSIDVASPLALWLGVTRTDLVQDGKPGTGPVAGP